MFTFTDSTGAISVRAYGETAKGILAEKRIPLVGDSVSVYGTVRIVEARPSITLNLPEKLTFTHPKAEELSIAGLQRAQEGMVAKTTGSIAFTKGYNTLTIVYLSDEAGNTVELPISKDMFSEQSISSLKIGSITTATGMVSDYRGRVQLIPRKADDVVVGGAVMKQRTKPKVLAIGDITAELVGTRITIQGEITAARKIRGKGIILTLKNGDDYISVPVWSDVYNKLPGKVNLKRGKSIRVSGKVGEYKHKLQVTPQDPSDIIFK